MFGRHRKDSEQATSDQIVEDRLDQLQGKGRPTPKRRDAQAYRKQRMTPPKTRKEASQQLRKRRYEERMKTQSALRTGEDRYLPARDQGKVRRFCRDLVDARFSVAEFLLPLLVLIVVLGFAGTNLQGLAWLVTIIATIGDTVWLTIKTRRELSRRFPGDSTRGAILYTLLRSSQLRRLRLPKPQVRRGQQLAASY
ncbi:MAG: DUF3043 domain-containing protein [Nocardioidaceae bacterium]